MWIAVLMGIEYVIRLNPGVIAQYLIVSPVHVPIMQFVSDSGLGLTPVTIV
jgi:hypothetical protein